MSAAGIHALQSLLCGHAGGDPLRDVALDAHLRPQVSSVRGPPGAPAYLHTARAGEGMWWGVYGLYTFSVVCSVGYGLYHVLLIEHTVCIYNYRV